MTREAFVEGEQERVVKRVTITVVSAKLLPWLGGRSAIPLEVVEAAAEVLSQAQETGTVRGFRTYPFAEDLHLQINTL